MTVLRIIDEPKAASLAYGWDKKKEGIVAVFDSGGENVWIMAIDLFDF